MSRRSFLRLGAAAVAGRGVYSVLDQFAAPQRASAATPAARPQEQYLVDGVRLLVDNGVSVVIPPIYNDVFTAKLAPGRRWDKKALMAAQKRLERALALIESVHLPNAAGLTIIVGWGLPYFRTFVPGPWQRTAPRDGNGSDPAVMDAISFPSDPPNVALEDNHVVFKVRSDSSLIVRTAETQLFGDATHPAFIGDMFQFTSRRIGFAGRGFDTTSAAKTLALKANVAGAASIPDRAQLMLGFTSTQAAALGPDNIVSFETLPGMTDQTKDDYFARGCAMHLSHLYLDLVRWYGRTYADRVRRMFSPSTDVPADQRTVTIPNGREGVSTLAQIRRDADAGLGAGHNALLQTATRLPGDVVDNYGQRRTKGTAVPLREDFDTLDDPFTWYRTTSGRLVAPPAASPGLHFAVFVPSSRRFHAARLAMDGVLPDGTDLRSRYAPRDLGINSTMTATHRQNFLIPPRAHRSFPLAELL